MPHLHAKHLLTATFLAVTPVVPGNAQDAPDQWTVMLIGDSWLPDTVRLYAEQIEADLGVDIFYTQRNTSLLPHANQMLQRGTWDAAIRDADVVVVGIVVMNDRPGYCTDQPGETPLRWPRDELAPMIDLFLAALAERVDPGVQAVRVALAEVIPDDHARWTANGRMAECLDIHEAINTAWAAGAAEHGFTTVDYISAWHGPDGTDRPPRSFYQPDGRHLSREGAQAAADVLLATGYHPLAP